MKDLGYDGPPVTARYAVKTAVVDRFSTLEDALGRVDANTRETYDRMGRCAEDVKGAVGRSERALSGEAGERAASLEARVDREAEAVKGMLAMRFDIVGRKLMQVDASLAWARAGLASVIVLQAVLIALVASGVI